MRVTTTMSRTTYLVVPAHAGQQDIERFMWRYINAALGPDDINYGYAKVLSQIGNRAVIEFKPLSHEDKDLGTMVRWPSYAACIDDFGHFLRVNAFPSALLDLEKLVQEAVLK